MVAVFSVQDDVASVLDANAYITVAEFKAYHDARGNDYTAATSDAIIQQCIVKATDYLDRRFRFVGVRQSNVQPTQWPRLDAFNVDELLIFGIPPEVKAATAEYALRALSAALMPDPVRDDTGQGVQSHTEEVGPISETRVYWPGGYELPAYPLADRVLLITGLVRQGARLVRA